MGGMGMGGRVRDPAGGGVDIDPAGQGGQCPKKNCGRPVLLNIEDLADERDGGGGGDGSDGVERGGEALKAFAHKTCGQVEDGDHGDDDCIARGGAEFIPVGGDKERHAASEQDGSENERDYALPPHPSDVDLSLGTPITQATGLFLFFFEGADAGGGLRVECAGRLPAI